MKQIAYIAFQGGGALGMAHLGAWREIARYYEIEGAAGTSAGSIVATLCAAKYQPEYAIHVFKNLAWPEFMKWQSVLTLLTRRNALSSGDRFRSWLEHSLAEHLSLKGQHVTFEKLHQITNIYLAIVACDLNDERTKPVIFNTDKDPDVSVGAAVRASISIPGLFVPVPNPLKGQELVDGGVLLNFPVEVLQSKAQEKNCPLIGVRFNRPIDYLESPRIDEVFRRAAALLLRQGSIPPDTVLQDPNYIDISIDISGFKSLNFNLSADQKDELISRGEIAAKLALAKYREHQRDSSSSALVSPLVKDHASSQKPGSGDHTPIAASGSASSVQRLDDSWRRDAIVDHDQVFGIRALLDKLAEELTTSERSWIISLFGEGGVGKTTAAYELVRLHARAAGFTRIAWVSAKSMYFSLGGGLRKEDDVRFFWSDLLKSIAERLKLDIGLSRAVWIRGFTDSIRALPSSEKCLIVIDNFETVEDAEAAIQYLEKEKISNPHKVIITTRESIQSMSSTIMERKITGFTSLQDACDFIRHLGRGDADIEVAPNTAFDNILDVTEGNPFLIKLIITRIKERHLPPEVVLRDLKQRRALGGAVRDYLYRQSLSDLERESGVDNARRLMSVFCTRLPGDSFTFDEIMDIGGFEDEDTFRTTLETAYNFALIRTHDLNRKYSIHSLLWQFTCG